MSVASVAESAVLSFAESLAGWLALAYFGIGILFAVPFALAGAGRVDPDAEHGSWGFRLLILPGSALFWPLLLRRWLRAEGPPEESNAHRRAAAEERA